MAEALPFRPRAAAAVAADVGAVREQLQALRRRSNRYVAQQAFYASASAVLAAAGGIVLLALLSSGLVFAIAVWVLLTAALAVVVRSTARALREWLGRRDAAARIDRRAGLKDRLTTLLAESPAGTRSRLWSLLVDENLERLPAWSPATLVPRGVPRTVWLLAAALSLALVSMMLRASTVGGSGPSFPGGAPATGAAGGPPAPGPNEAEGEAEDGAGAAAFLMSLPEELRRAILGAGADSAPPDSGLARRPSRLRRGGRDSASPPTEESTGAGSQGSGKANDRARSPGRDVATDGATNPPASPPERNDRAAAEGSSVPAPMQGDAPKTVRPVQPGKSGPGQQPDPALAGNTGKGGAQGAGGGGDPSGLYGEPMAGGVEPQGAFTLDLEAERNRDAGGEEDDEGAALRGTLAADARLDDAVRRAQVPAEYEAIVQRLFHRDEAGEP